MILSEAECRGNFATQYSYLTDAEVRMIYGRALETYLDLAFPFDPSLTDVPTDHLRGYQWIYECMLEIVERSGCSSMTSYSENGLSITWDRSGISKGLLTRLIPKVGNVQ